jgi:hypothetical protein
MPGAPDLSSMFRRPAAEDPGAPGDSDEPDDTTPSLPGQLSGPSRRRVGRVGPPLPSLDGGPETPAEPSYAAPDAFRPGRPPFRPTPGASDFEAPEASEPEPGGSDLIRSMPGLGPAMSGLGAPGLGARAEESDDGDLDDAELDGDDDEGGAGGGLSSDRIDGLAGQLYERIRDRLRRELLVDRERSLMLTDWR